MAADATRDPRDGPSSWASSRSPSASCCSSAWPPSTRATRPPSSRPASRRARAQLHRPLRRVPRRAADPAALRRGRAPPAPGARARGLEALLVPADRRPLHQGRRHPRRCCSPSPRFLALTFGTVALRGRARAGGRRHRASSWPALLVADFSRTGRLHRGRHRALRRPHPLHPVLLRRRSCGGGRRPRRRPRCARCAPPGPTTGRRRRKEKMRREVIRKHTQHQDAEAESLPRVRKVKAGAAEDEDASRRRRGEPRRPAPRRPPCARPTPAPEAAALRLGAPAARTSGEDDDAGRGRAEAAARRRVRPRRAATREAAAPEVRGSYTLPPIVDPRRAEADRPRSTTTACSRRAAILQAKCGEFGVHGRGQGDPPRARGHDLRVQARRRGQVLEDRRPRRRPRPRPRGRVDPHRPHQRQGQRGDRDPERGPRDHLPARDPRVGRLPPSPRAGSPWPSARP